MRELLVEVLTSFAESHPYLLLACALIGSMWLARSLLHKARLFTRTLVNEIHGGKAELREWGAELSELRREVTNWKSDP